MMKALKNSRGQAMLVAIVVSVTVMLILVPAIIKWAQDESKWTIKEQKSSTAFNLAEAAINRGAWKLKSSTSTWEQARLGATISGYNFDATYNDISGGTYRIKFSAVSQTQVAVYGEGRDSESRETRAIKAVYYNTTIPGALFSASGIDIQNHFVINWGPIMAHGNIDITDAEAAKKYFPRKFSRQVVTGQGIYLRDVNGMDPPNTDNLEWWSNYDVPDMPLLDFTTMRASASTNGTLNICDAQVKGQTAGECWFNNSSTHALAKKNLIWYWDASITNANCTACTTVKLRGNQFLYGTIVARGNFSWEGSDSSAPIVNVPSDASGEYLHCDTSAINEYPADNGSGVTRAKFNLGTETWTWGNGKCYESNSDVPAAGNADISIRGFLYVGGNLAMQSTPDLMGAVWIVGTISRTGSGISLIFYDDGLSNIPVLNVVLDRVSWQETQPDTQAWAAP